MIIMIIGGVITVVLGVMKWRVLHKIDVEERIKRANMKADLDEVETVIEDAPEEEPEVELDMDNQLYKNWDEVRN